MYIMEKMQNKKVGEHMLPYIEDLIKQLDGKSENQRCFEKYTLQWIKERRELEKLKKKYGQKWNIPEDVADYYRIEGYMEAVDQLIHMLKNHKKPDISYDMVDVLSQEISRELSGVIQEVLNRHLRNS